MKYLRDDLQVEYRRLRNYYPDIEYLQKPLMNVSDILRAYFILADYFSDATASEATETMLFAIRDMTLLQSALGRQTAAFGGYLKYSKPLDVCSTLFFGLVKDHAFADGNKRTALLTLLYQLDCYSFCPKAPQKEFEKLVVAIASNSLEFIYPKEWKHAMSKDRNDRSVEVIARLIREMTARKDNSYHLEITPLVLQNAINRIPNCECNIDGIKIKLSRKTEHRVLGFRKPDTYKYYTIPFRGNTRTIGAATIREALVTLDLYDQFPDYQSFVNGADPRYMLIQQFEAPLRRLKDK